MTVICAWALLASVPLAIALHRREASKALGWAIGLSWMVVILALLGDLSSYDACGNGGPCSSTERLAAFSTNFKDLVVACASAAALGASVLLLELRPTKR